MSNFLRYSHNKLRNLIKKHTYFRDIVKIEIIGNFHKLKFLENSFQRIFRKNIFKIFGYLFLLCYRLENFKAPFCKKIFGKFLRFPKFPKIKFYENFRLYDRHAMFRVANSSDSTVNYI